MRMTNRLRAVRKQSRLTAVALAQRVGVSRQTIHAIESGAYTPNTSVALKLARELEVSVEDLFELAESEPRPPALAELVEGAAYAGAPLRLCQVGDRLIATAWSPEVFALPVSDATARSDDEGGRVAIGGSHAPLTTGERLLLSGCDPAASLLANQLRHTAGVELILVPSSSKKALQQLRKGLVHLAGTHLSRSSARIPPGCRIFTFAEWEEGLVVAAGNPKQIRGIADLARRTVRIINREPGAGSRALLDAGLARTGVPAVRVRGYDRVAAGHLSAAWEVRQGKADCCVAPRVAAQVFGLDFIPLQAERYELAIPEKWMGLPAMQALLDTLQRSVFQRQLAAAGGYETTNTGAETSGSPC